MKAKDYDGRGCIALLYAVLRHASSDYSIRRAGVSHSKMRDIKPARKRII